MRIILQTLLLLYTALVITHAAPVSNQQDSTGISVGMGPDSTTTPFTDVGLNVSDSQQDQSTGLDKGTTVDTGSSVTSEANVTEDITSSIGVTVTTSGLPLTDSGTQTSSSDHSDITNTIAPGQQSSTEIPEGMESSPTATDAGLDGSDSQQDQFTGLEKDTTVDTGSSVTSEAYVTEDVTSSIGVTVTTSGLPFADSETQSSSSRPLSGESIASGFIQATTNTISQNVPAEDVQSTADIMTGNPSAFSDATSITNVTDDITMDSSYVTLNSSGLPLTTEVASTEEFITSSVTAATSFITSGSSGAQHNSDSTVDGGLSSPLFTNGKPHSAKDFSSSNIPTSVHTESSLPVASLVSSGPYPDSASYSLVDHTPVNATGATHVPSSDHITKFEEATNQPLPTGALKESYGSDLISVSVSENYAPSQETSPQEGSLTAVDTSVTASGTRTSVVPTSQEGSVSPTVSGTLSSNLFLTSRNSRREQISSSKSNTTVEDESTDFVSSHTTHEEPVSEEDASQTERHTLHSDFTEVSAKRAFSSTSESHPDSAVTSALNATGSSSILTYSSDELAASTVFPLQNDSIQLTSLTFAPASQTITSQQIGISSTSHSDATWPLQSSPMISRTVFSTGASEHSKSISPKAVDRTFVSPHQEDRTEGTSSDASVHHTLQDAASSKYLKNDEFTPHREGENGDDKEENSKHEKFGHTEVGEKMDVHGPEDDEDDRDDIEHSNQEAASGDRHFEAEKKSAEERASREESDDED